MSRNPRLAGIAPSLIRAISGKRTATSIDLGLGEPTLRPSIKYFEQAGQWVAAHGCPYTPNAGDPGLRKMIAEHFAYQDFTQADNVCVTNGSQEALFAAISGLLDPASDELLIVEPAYGSYAKVAELTGVRTRRVGMDADDFFALDVERILAAIQPQTTMLALCSPCNPSGRVLRKRDAQELANGLLQRRGEPIIVLFDEVYRELGFLDDTIDFSRLYPNTVAINSLSKSNALTGLRLGWALGPTEHIATITKAHAWATSAASTFAQQVASAIFADAAGLSEHAAWYRTRAYDVGLLLQKAHVPATPIEGTFYTMVRFPQITDSVAAALTLAQDDEVLVIPGAAFGACTEAWLRLSIVAPLDRIEEGIRRMKKRFL